jgi:uncharacterized protein YecE (DUF72 family)
MKKAEIRLGTSAFTAAGWPGTFYPDGVKPAEYLSYYAQRFDAVEIDSTFYRTPSVSTIRGWYAKTPKNFLFAAKVVQAITHEKVLVDCEDDLKKYLAVMDILGEKLGPLLFQFPYFNRKAFASGADFLARLVPFLKTLPRGYKLAVEIRNKNWLVPAFTDSLAARGVALALIDHPWMPRPQQLMERIDPITADFTYIRWLGDRKEIEEQTKTWDKIVVDRKKELGEWANVCWKLNARGVAIFAYANNHYAGNGPGTVELFRKLFAALELKRLEANDVR